MNSSKKNNEQYYLDVAHIIKILKKRLWAIILIGIIIAAMVCCYFSFFVTPTYSSSIMLYVNNSSISIGNTTISASELVAAQTLVDTYIVILNNRTTMEMVAEKAGIDKTPRELMSMIHSEPVEETEVFRVVVNSTDPYEAALIASCIAEVLPVRVASVMDGSSMRIVDDAVVNTNKVAPSVTKNTVVAFILGCIIATFFFIILAAVDNTIRSDEMISDRYDAPILAKIPNLISEKSGKGYSYYKAYHSGYKAENDCKEVNGK